MHNHKNRKAVSTKFVYFILSPLFSSSLMYVFGLALVLFPPVAYERILKERNHMFLDPQVIFLTTLCYIFFVSGILINRKSRSVVFNRRISLRIDMKWGIYVLLCLSNLLMLFTVIFIISRIGFTEYISAAIGKSTNSRLDILDVLKDGYLTWTNQFALPIILYSVWMIFTRNAKYLIIPFFTSLILYALNIAPGQSKEPILKFLLSIGITWTAARLYTKKFKITKTILAFSICTILASYVLSDIQSRRVSGPYNETTSISTDLVGYFPASYNRLALLIKGQLKIENSGFPYYTAQWIWGIPGLKDINQYIFQELDIKYPADSYKAWISSFQYTKEAYLNPRYIWVTIFGYVFSDFGWFAPLWFFFYGFFCEYFFILWVAGRISGILCYPFLLLSNLQWYATVNVGATRDLFFAIIISLVLSIFRQESKNDIYLYGGLQRRKLHQRANNIDNRADV